MPQVMRRTPASEEAMQYGYRDFLQDIIGKTIEDTVAGFRRPLDLSNEKLLEMGLAGIGGATKFTKVLGPKVAKETAAIVKKFKSQGLTYDAFVDLVPDKPEFAYHQWTFRGEGPLKRATVATKGTGMKEFEEMVADRVRKFSKEPTPTKRSVLSSREGKQTASTWQTLREGDRTLQTNLRDWLLGKTTVAQSPSAIYRGVPKGTKSISGGEEFVHGTPWGFSAARGGKGAFGDPKSTDVYKFPVMKDTLYYRGGSLAGDPLESTRIKNIKGMTWDALLEESKSLFGRELVRERAKARRLGYKFSEIDAQHLAEKVVNDMATASFETDILGKAGIWRGQSVPYELDKIMPKLRSRSTLRETVRRKRKQGFSDEDIPELRILKRKD